MTFSLTFGITLAAVLTNMAGHWHAVGERRQMYSGRQTRISAVTQAQVVSSPRGDTLVSESHVTEQEIDGEQRQYRTAYWMRAHESQAQRFDLGAGLNPNTPARAEGVFEELAEGGARLRVTQRLGGDYRIESETQFGIDPSRIGYRELTYHGEALLSETHLIYRRQ